MPDDTSLEKLSGQVKKNATEKCVQRAFDTGGFGSALLRRGLGRKAYQRFLRLAKA